MGKSIVSCVSATKRENCVSDETLIGWHTVIAITLNITLVYVKTKQTTLCTQSCTHTTPGDTNRPYQLFDKIGYYYNILGNGSQRKLIKMIME